MKTESHTTKEIDDFLSRADFSLIEEIHEEQMIPKELSFEEFFRRYQKKHIRRYGKSLPLHAV